MNRRIAYKRIKRDILTKLWLRNYECSIRADIEYTLLLISSKFPGDSIITEGKYKGKCIYEPASRLTEDSAKSELNNAHKSVSRRYYINKKLFRKIVSQNLTKLCQN